MIYCKEHLIYIQNVYQSIRWIFFLWTESSATLTQLITGSENFTGLTRHSDHRSSVQCLSLVFLQRSGSCCPPCCCGRRVRSSSGSAACGLCGAGRSSGTRSPPGSAAQSPGSTRSPPSASAGSPASRPDTRHWPGGLHGTVSKHKRKGLIYFTGHLGASLMVFTIAKPLPSTSCTNHGARQPPGTAAGRRVGLRGLAAGWCPGCSAASSGPACRLWPGSNWPGSPEKSASGERSARHGTAGGRRREKRENRWGDVLHGRSNWRKVWLFSKLDTAVVIKFKSWIMGGHQNF